MADVEGFEKAEAQLWGIIAEWLSFIYLMLKGYSLLERRWRSPVGEIDLIASRGELVVFVEVKARRTREKALEAVSTNQRHRIENAARNWIASNPTKANCKLRFDVMAVVPWTLPHHVEDAWRPARS